MAPVTPETMRVGAVLALSSAEHVGPRVLRDLVDRCGDPLEALATAPWATELSHAPRAGVLGVLGGCGREAARDAAAAAARRAVRAAAAALSPDDRLLAYGVGGYPSRLERLHFPPPVLWARGPLPADAPRAVAVVGTRSATRSARVFARDLAAGLAERGVRVVSGLASGIDGEAHRGALEVRGETAAVLGSGLRFTYPDANRDIYRALRKGGLILTEFPPAVRPEPHNFPRRNRIVAALSDAVVVVQAGRRSGALLTAREAEEIGVEVMACPGDPRLPGSVGCHALLRDGAAIVTGADDVLEALGWTHRAGGAWPAPAAGTGRSRESTPLERALLERLEGEPAPLDQLADAAGGVREAAAALARLELEGLVVGLPGGRYELTRLATADVAGPDEGRPA